MVASGTTLAEARSHAQRAIDLSRSLAAEAPLFTDISTALSESLSNSRPGDRNRHHR